jgi:hypothetical protein
MVTITDANNGSVRVTVAVTNSVGGMVLPPLVVFKGTVHFHLVFLFANNDTDILSLWLVLQVLFT